MAGHANRLVARWLLLCVGIALAAGGAVLVSPLGQAIAGSSSPPAPPAIAQTGGGVPDVGAPTQAPPPATLTAAQRDAALAIARSTPAVRALIANRNVSTLVVPWTTDSGRFLGAGIDMTWDHPIAVAAIWPVMAYDETEKVSPPYLSTTARVEATNVTGVHLAIDLTTGKLVGMGTMPGAKISGYRVDPAFINTLPPQPATPR